MQHLAYKVFTTSNLSELEHFNKLSSDHLEAINIVDLIFPFKTNNYVTNHLIDWDNLPNDPIFKITFPSKQNLSNKDYNFLKSAILTKDKHEIKIIANKIRSSLNPHPAEQLQNIPTGFDGIQHKYRETVLFFPRQGQTCHAYCTFCFRWPQFTGVSDWKIVNKDVQDLIDYLKIHPEVSDLIFTGGDPLIMSASVLSDYINPILDANIGSLKSIRFGTKVFGFWPYRFLTDTDCEEILSLFEKIINRGIHLGIMAHISHPNELNNTIVKKSINAIKKLGAVIRTQTPILKNINDTPETLKCLWDKQVNLGMIPYYLFVPRDTGSQYFQSLPLVKILRIFQESFRILNGLGKTVRGPVMSCNQGKILIEGLQTEGLEKRILMKFIQAKNQNYIGKHFSAKYNDSACWIDDLIPIDGKNYIDSNF